MKYRFFALLTGLLLFAACGDDDDAVVNAELAYDGPNASAPFIDPGIHLAAARFSTAETAPFAGRDLEEIEFYLLDVPDACQIIIMGPGSNNQPGPILFSVDVSNGVAANSWNRYFLPTPIRIEAEDIWIGIEVTHNTRLSTIGCDAGPARTDGDWIFSSGINQWQTFRNFTNGGVDINWNIRGQVGE